jgi:hypothetical protein
MHKLVAIAAANLAFGGLAQAAMAETCRAKASVSAAPAPDSAYVFTGEVRSADCRQGDCAGTAMISMDLHWADGSTSHQEDAVQYRIKPGQGAAAFSRTLPLPVEQGPSGGDIKAVTAHAYIVTCFTPLVGESPAQP